MNWNRHSCVSIALGLLWLPLLANEATKTGPKWNYKPEDLWAFQPVRHYPVPTAGIDPKQVLTPVDAFLLQKLR